MRRPSPALLLPLGLLAGAAGCAVAPLAPSAEASPMPFDPAVRQLIQALEAAAPEGVRVEVRESSPAVLGWRAPEGTPARILALWTPGGVHLHLGLLPCSGRLSSTGRMQGAGPEELGSTPALLAVGPGLAVVSAPSPQVALTLDVQQRGGALLARTLEESIGAWRAGTELEGAARPAGLEAATRVVRHPHWLEIELAADADFDPAPLLAAGERALSFREAPAVRGGLLPVPTLAFASP